MKKQILITLLTFLSLNTYAQFSINYSIGYGTYQMDDMKSFSRQITNQLTAEKGVPLKLTDNFPSYIQHSGEITYQLKQHEFGLTGSYMTAGAKIAYADYSGNYQTKIITNGFKFGPVYKYHFWETLFDEHRFSVFGELSPSFVLTDLKVKEEGVIYESPIKEKTQTKILNKKFGFSIQPMVGCRLVLFKHYLIHLKTGYDFELGSKLNPYARIDWSGFRLQGGIGYMF